MKNRSETRGLAERLDEIIRRSGLSLVKFAQKTGVSKNTLVNYKSGATSPDAVFLEKLCREFRTDPRWLLLGDAAFGRREPYVGFDFGGDEYFGVPLLESRVAAGPQGEILYSEVADYYPFKSWWVDKLTGGNDAHRGSLFLIRVRGDSMSPTINQGETAMVDTWEPERLDVIAGRIYLVVLPDGTVALKRVVLSRDDSGASIVCLSDNTTDYRPFEFALDPDKQLKNYILGRVRWAGKEFE